MQSFRYSRHVSSQTIAGGVDMDKQKRSEKKEPQIIIDPLGSYTGIPLERDEMPVQDADDL